MRQIIKGASFAFVLFVAGCFSKFALSQQSVQFDSVQITLNNKPLIVEFAHSWPQRQQGLMYRKTMCADCGMLFKFDGQLIGSMWMKNTFIPLDIAFIRADGVITDIKAATPLDLTPVQSSQKIRYALEMNQGWFAANQISVGDVITIQE